MSAIALVSVFSVTCTSGQNRSSSSSLVTMAPLRSTRCARISTRRGERSSATPSWVSVHVRVSMANGPKRTIRGLGGLQHRPRGQRALGGLFGGVGDDREVAHLAARLRGRPCRRDAASRRAAAGGAPSRARRSLHRSPSRLAIAAGRSRSGDPSGRPQTARTCCSNWLVTQASKVRWPELCGRGASSFTSSSLSALRKNSTQSTPT